uniref:Growth factor receptor bound protein 10 n=1 Tax=Eptatretus burgeri TaxID=7764 RepID=A0A8C4QZZ5_EPTBU
MTLEAKTSSSGSDTQCRTLPALRTMGSLSSPCKPSPWQGDIRKAALCPYDCRACEANKKLQLRLVIRVFSEDGTGRSLEIPAGTTAREVCRSLALKNQCLDDSCWALVESYPHIGLERSLEDHEIVAQVQAGWGSDCDNKLFFRKNYAKYEFFKNPVQFFPEHMASTSFDTNGTTPHSQIIQNLINASGCPEIQGYLHVKDPGKKSWKKLYCFLRPSGLYSP